ncbi:MAG: hypothetical protein ACJ8DJ_11290, partial [Gemmatimonadales bacterium]
FVMNQGMFCSQSGHRTARRPVSDPPLSSIRARDTAKILRFCRHGAEIPLTTAGTGPRTERLENYAWIVELD